MSRDLQLVISGKSYTDYNEAERLVAQLGLSDLVHFVQISDEDLPILYQAAEVFVTLSLYEGFGLPILEAMASGTPVVASDSTSLPEVVGEAGILVNPFNIEEVATAIGELIQRGIIRERYVEAGLNRAKIFTWEKCAQKTLTVYRKAVSE